MNIEKKDHPIITKCLNHLQVVGADYKIQQLVYMYMKELSVKLDDKQTDKVLQKKENMPQA
ncbi:hypothetical protein LC040_01740 [Bacillus tianshenii]|nr:hypothetical protein LC040_01740 [Bacillus tianshenii]